MIALWASPSWGFEVDCDIADGDQLVYKINSDDFGTAQRDQIHAAADAWDAGDPYPMRGAKWHFFFGAYTSSDGGLCDGSNDIRKKPRSWFVDQGYPNASARVATCTMGSGGCTRIDADMTFAEDISWVTSMASDADLPNRSIGQTAMHEFGHVLGFFDEADEPATMNSPYAHSGDTAEAHLRISEDDYVGLLYIIKGDSSIGKNLFLQRWDQSVGADEVWTDDQGGEDGQDWTATAGQTISASNGPRPILAMIHAPINSQSPLIEWRLSADTNCFAGGDILIGTRTPTISSNSPYEVTPNGGYTIPANTAPGSYRLCAKIDADGQVDETVESDNVIMSEKLFVVQ